MYSAASLFRSFGTICVDIGMIIIYVI